MQKLRALTSLDTARERKSEPWQCTEKDKSINDENFIYARHVKKVIRLYTNMYWLNSKKKLQLHKNFSQNKI